MSYDYAASLSRVRDARNKRSRDKVTNNFSDTLRREHRSLPMFDDNIERQQEHSTTEDDQYSNQLLRVYNSSEVSRGLLAKRVNGNATVSLIQPQLH